ncbi:MAG: hypothetical protein ABIG64_03875 [Candidatus Omnitrophota bacterium]
MKRKDRCWEYMRCGEEITCSVFPDGGETCWEIAGTMRSNEAEKRLEKLSQIAQESGTDITEEQLQQQFKSVKQVKLCKYIERYGSCKCCPYYKFAEKFERDRRGSSKSDAF